MGGFNFNKRAFFGMEPIKKGNIINFGVVLGEPSYYFWSYHEMSYLSLSWRDFICSLPLKVKRDITKIIENMLTKNKHLSKFTKGRRGLMAWTFCQKRKLSKCGQEGGLCRSFDRCPKLFSFFILTASLTVFAHQSR